MSPEKFLHFTLQIESGPEGDDREAGELVRNLLREIRQTDMAAAAIPTSPINATSPTGESGAKGDPITAGQIAMSVLPATIPAMIIFLQSWLLRQQSQTVTVKIREVEVEIPRDLSNAEFSRIVDQVKEIAKTSK